MRIRPERDNSHSTSTSNLCIGLTKLKGDVFGLMLPPMGNPVPIPSRAFTKPSTENAAHTAQKVVQQISLICFSWLQLPRRCTQLSLHASVVGALISGNKLDACKTRTNHSTSTLQRKYIDGRCSARRVDVLAKFRGKIAL